MLYVLIMYDNAVERTFGFYKKLYFMSVDAFKIDLFNLCDTNKLYGTYMCRSKNLEHFAFKFFLYHLTLEQQLNISAFYYNAFFVTDVALFFYIMQKHLFKHKYETPDVLPKVLINIIDEYMPNHFIEYYAN